MSMASIAMLVITGGYIISDSEGNGMIITSDYGSFPHSPHLSPVSLLVSHSLSHYYPITLIYRVDSWPTLISTM